MSSMLSPVEVATRTERAVAAAGAAGRAAGLTVTDPQVLYDSFSVVVHLKPAPVVARIPTVLPTFLADPEVQAARQRVELDVVGWLARQGLAVTVPSPLVPAEPVLRDGFSMTLWSYVEHDKSVEPDYAARAAATAELHGCLRDYPGRLGFMEPLAMISPCLDELAGRTDLIDAADLDRAEREWSRLAPLLTDAAAFDREFGVATQPIHGDSPPYNMIPTAAGLLYADFEDPTVGPIEWDLTLVGPEGEAAYDAAARERGMRPSDRRLLRVLDSARMIQVVSCLAMVPQQPSMLEALRGMTGYWRELPFAGGIDG